MSLQTNLTSFAARSGAEDKALRTLINGNLANLSALTTTDKTNLVNAINELVAATPDLSLALLKANNLSDIVDAAIARTNLDIRSTAEITSEITAAIATITLASLNGLTQTEVDARIQLVVDSAPAALDTLNELAAALGDDPNFAATLTTQMSKKVDVSIAQTFTVAEQLQGCQNIGIGDPETDYVSIFEAALI